jgi:hypothetical protein
MGRTFGKHGINKKCKHNFGKKTLKKFDHLGHGRPVYTGEAYVKKVQDAMHCRFLAMMYHQKKGYFGLKHYENRKENIIFHIPIYIQQDAMLHSLFYLETGNCSTCFGRYLHPSSGAHTTVSTASGICHTVTATCR